MTDPVSLITLSAEKGESLAELGRRDEWTSLWETCATSLAQLEGDVALIETFDALSRLRSQAARLGASDLSGHIATLVERVKFGFTVTADRIMFERGYISGSFASSEDNDQVVLNNPLLLLVDGEIKSLKNLIPILERVMETKKPLVVLCRDVGDEVLEMLVVNKNHGGLQSVVIDTPGDDGTRGSMLREIASAIGGKVIGDASTLNAAVLDDLGKVRQVVATFNWTRITR